RRRPCVARARVMKRVDLVAVTSGDEPLLEREGSGRRLDEGSKRVVGRGEEGAPEIERCREPDSGRRERRSLAEELRAEQVNAGVAVAEPEPGLTPEVGDGCERVPALLGPSPAALLVGDAGERVEDAVEVGRDVETEHLDVVTYVAYYADVVRFDYS